MIIRYLAFVILSTLFASWTHAAVVVYTDRDAWQAAAEALRPGPFFMNQDFNSLAPDILSLGRNSFWTDDSFGFFIVEIDGLPSRNSIEDGSINPVLSIILSPNESTFYFGEVSDTTQLQFLFQPFAAPPNAEGFGADWVTVPGSGLSFEVSGTNIDFDTYLPSGVGFLGIITEDKIKTKNPILLNGSGQLFGMDNLVSVTTPIPTTAWLFGSALLGLGAVKRRKA